MKTLNEIIDEARLGLLSVTIDEAQTAIAASDILVDVREFEEYERGHLPGAVHISRGVLEGKVLAHPACQSADTKILLYCRTNNRAILAADSLRRFGYRNVSYLDFGFEGWNSKGLPVESSASRAA